MCKLTRHGEKRVRQRCGASKKTAIKFANNALDKGLRHFEANGNLTKYLNEIYLSYESANNLRIFQNKIWIFRNLTLITVYNLPYEYRRTVKKLIDRRNDN